MFMSYFFGLFVTNFMHKFIVLIIISADATPCELMVLREDPENSISKDRWLARFVLLIKL